MILHKIYDHTYTQSDIEKFYAWNINKGALLVDAGGAFVPPEFSLFIFKGTHQGFETFTENRLPNYRLPLQPFQDW